MAAASAYVSRVVAAAVAVAIDHDVEVREPVVIRDLTNVLVHLAPSSIVARAPGLNEVLDVDPSWLRRTIDVTSFLVTRAAPVAPPTEVVPPGPVQRDGIWMTFWRHIPTATERREPGAGGAALRRIHEALSAYNGPLPRFDQLLNVGVLLDRAAERGALARSDLDLLREEHARITSTIAGLDLPLRPLHGDAQLSNVLWSAEGPLWNDFEAACIGPLEWDMAPTIANERLLGVDPRIGRAFYRGYGDHPREWLEPFVELRALMQTVYGAHALLARPDDGNVRVWANKRLEWWRARARRSQPHSAPPSGADI